MVPEYEPDEASEAMEYLQQSKRALQQQFLVSTRSWADHPAWDPWEKGFAEEVKARL